MDEKTIKKREKKAKNKASKMERKRLAKEEKEKEEAAAKKKKSKATKKSEVRQEKLDCVDDDPTLVLPERDVTMKHKWPSKSPHMTPLTSPHIATKTPLKSPHATTKTSLASPHITNATPLKSPHLPTTTPLKSPSTITPHKRPVKQTQLLSPPGTSSPRNVSGGFDLLGSLLGDATGGKKASSTKTTKTLSGAATAVSTPLGTQNVVSMPVFSSKNTVKTQVLSPAVKTPGANVKSPVTGRIPLSPPGVTEGDLTADATTTKPGTCVFVRESSLLPSINLTKCTQDVTTFNKSRKSDSTASNNINSASSQDLNSENRNYYNDGNNNNKSTNVSTPVQVKEDRLGDKLSNTRNKIKKVNGSKVSAKKREVN